MSQLLFFRSTWGMDEPDVAARLRRIREAGFDGVELGVPDSQAECADVRALLNELGLAVVVQQWTKGSSAQEHADSFERQYERALTLKPLHVNSHTGVDWFTLDQNLTVFDRAAALEKSIRVPVLHETHRGRALFSIPSTLALLTARPDLKLAADFSHWCCVHESLLQDQADSVARAIACSFYIHARVGYSQGPQVTDPRAPEWNRELQAHLEWWQRIAARAHDEHRTLGICPEFGPSPYLTLLPFTGTPIANLWEINMHMRDWLKERLLSQETACTGR